MKNIKSDSEIHQDGITSSDPGNKATLYSEEFSKCLVGFTQWLRVIGYSASTVYYFPTYARSFLTFLELNGINRLNKIRSTHVDLFIFSLSQRKNVKTGKLLSPNYILNYLNSVKRFFKYLSECYLIDVNCHVIVQGSRSNERPFLTKRDIESLYNSCQNDPDGILNRAILSTYYGLGLRRSEGVALNIGDVNKNEGVVYVRQGKLNKDRYVPMSQSVYHDIKKYIISIRNSYLEKVGKSDEPALFISYRGKRITGSGVYERLQNIAKAAGLKIPLSLHSLRHSIATHLLEAGMELEHIGSFLGHKSVESTQIYAHLNQKII